MSINVRGYEHLPCSQCMSLHASVPRVEVKHLHKIGDDVVIGPKGYDVDTFYQCQTCGALWEKHRDLDPGGRMTFVEPVRPPRFFYKRKESE